MTFTAETAESAEHEFGQNTLSDLGVFGGCRGNDSASTCL
jgi:hypothetical protein